MATSGSEFAARYWDRIARRVANRRNLALAAPILAATATWGAVLAGGLMALDKWSGIEPGPIAAAALALALTAIGGLALLRLRGTPLWWGKSDAFVFVEDRLRLFGQLSAASEGMAPWPPPTPSQDRRVLWHRPLSNLALGLCVPTMVALLPESKPLPLVPFTPPVAAEVERTLEELKTAKIFNKENLLAYEESLRELTKGNTGQADPAAQLEALDHLQEKLEREIGETRRALKKAIAAAEPRDGGGPNSPMPDAPGMPGGLEGSSTSMKNELGQALAELAESGVGLDEETLARLREELSRGAEENGEATTDEGARAAAEEALSRLEERQGKAAGNGKGQGQGENELGQGEIARGPGHSPLDLTNRSEGDVAASESLPPDDLRSTPRGGDRVGESSSRPETVTPEGTLVPGGSAFGRESDISLAPERLLSLEPVERERLKAFFR